MKKEEKTQIKKPKEPATKTHTLITTRVKKTKTIDEAIKK